MSVINNIGTSSTAWQPKRPDVAKMSEDLFARLDTDGKGAIDEAEIASALGQAGGADSNAASLVKALDGDSDGSVSKEELSQGMQKLADQFEAQFNAARTTHAQGQDGGAMAPAGAAQYDDADSNEDGTVSMEERMAYQAEQASKRAEAAGGGQQAALGKLQDQLAKAYGDESGEAVDSALSVTA